LEGAGFTLIPQNALGILAIANDNPLQALNTQYNDQLFSIEVLNDFELVATSKSAVIHASPNYLGGIVSQDRNSIYWTNNTEPLP
jgi:hypothetical protein